MRVSIVVESRVGSSSRVMGSWGADENVGNRSDWAVRAKSLCGGGFGVVRNVEQCTAGDFNWYRGCDCWNGSCGLEQWGLVRGRCFWLVSLGIQATLRSVAVSRGWWDVNVKRYLCLVRGSWVWECKLGSGCLLVVVD